MAEALRDRTGGIARLAAFLSEYGEAVEFDLHRYWGRGITEVTWRELRVFLDHLPAESATAYAVHGDAAAWGVSEHLLAAITDVLQWANYQRCGGKGPRPHPTPRPGTTEPRTRRHGHTDLSPDEAAALLERARTGALHRP